MVMKAGVFTDQKREEHLRRALRSASEETCNGTAATWDHLCGEGLFAPDGLPVHPSIDQGGADG